MKRDVSRKDAEGRMLVIISDTDVSELTIQILQSMRQAGIDPEIEVHDSGNPMVFKNLLSLGFNCKKVARFKKINVFIAFRRLSKTISVGRFETIYISGQYACLIGLYTSFLRRVPNRIFTRHHTDSNYQKRKSSLRLLRGFFFDVMCNHLATKIVAVSEVVKSFMVEKEGVEAAKIVVINNSVSEEFISIPPERFPGDRIRFGVVSRLTNVKGVEYIAEAFLKFHHENENCSITIVGADSDSSKLVHRILDHLPAESCKFVPRIANIKAFYREIDVFIHAPISINAEAFGLVYLEALYSGVHCIFTGSGIVGIDEELQKLCHIVEFQDSESILEAMREYSFSTKPRKFIPNTVFDKYSTSKMRNSYSDLWKNLN